MRPEGFNYLPEAWRAYIADLESVRSEARNAALEEAAKVCEELIPKDARTPFGQWRDEYDDYERCARHIRKAIQSPARVPEDEHQFSCQTEGKPCDRWCGANPCLDVHSTELRK